MLIDIIAGARPNFIKIAPIIESLRTAQLTHKGLAYRLIHTGQHYDEKMSGSFFKQLDITEPDINLGVGSGTQAEQTGKIMIKYEEILLKKPSDLCIVVGDVTSTMACSIAAKKLNIKVAHVEAGIRSLDLSMPEEINRILTDSITDYFFTTSITANENLLRTGVRSEDIFFVGNTMIDTLIKQMPNFIKPSFWDELGLKESGYLITTLHRPANVDNQDLLKNLITQIVDNSEGLPIIFPVHPRTAKNIAKLGISYPNLILIEPLSYLEFNYLVKNCKAVITDSGGITEEATVMNIPCMTLRNSTERPETCNIGTNMLLGTDPEAIAPAMKKLFSGNWQKGNIPELWDGKTAIRIVSIILRIMN